MCVCVCVCVCVHLRVLLISSIIPFAGFIPFLQETPQGQVFVPEVDDGTSAEIQIPDGFPFGLLRQYSVYVRFSNCNYG